MFDSNAPNGTAVRQTARIGSQIFASPRNPAVWDRNLDCFAAAGVATLPWSTTPPAIFIGLWFVFLLPRIKWREFANSLAQPACSLPLLLFALALIGTLWSDGAWAEQQRSLEKTLKLLVIPFLIYHFSRSPRGHWALIAFLISCVLLMALSWLELVAPWLKMKENLPLGIPVKSYIAQNHEFTLCMFALAYPAITLWRERKFALAAACAGLMLAFFTNMMFVATARTALVYIPALLLLFMALHLNVRTSVLVLVAAIASATLVWFTSPYLRARVANVAIEYQDYQNNMVSSTAQRLIYWTKSAKFIGEAPLVGHGTGSTMELFDRDAVGNTGLMAEVVSNPHNQTLNVAVQWGVLGVIILYAMWLSHLLLFREGGLIAWIGLIIVAQNIVSSTLNSHLFDFHEGWIYVLGVGIVGGMTLRMRAERGYAASSGWLSRKRAEVAGGDRGTAAST